MPFVATEKARIYYEIADNGGHSEGHTPTLVFAHGAGGNTASWWQQVPFFSRYFSVITFDHRGFGRSDCALEDFSPIHFEGDLLAILNQEKIEQVHLVCQSMGGWTGVRSAALHPHRIASLVLANTPGAVYTDALRLQLQGLPGPNDNPQVRSIALSARFAERNPEGAYLYQQISNFNQPDMPIATLMAPESFIAPEVLENFSVPALTVTSDLDAIFPRTLLDESAALINAQTVFVENSGHSTYFEQPQIFNQLVLKFLQHREQQQ